METIGSKRSYALTWCMPNNDDDDDDDDGWVCLAADCRCKVHSLFGSGQSLIALRCLLLILVNIPL